MYLELEGFFFLPKRETLFFFFSVDYRQSYEPKCTEFEENTAALRGGILFRLVAVLLTSKSESESESERKKKFRRLDVFARQVNDVLVDSSGPFSRYMYSRKTA